MESLSSLNTTFRVKLLDRKIIAERTYSLFIEKPEQFSFEAGQNIDLALAEQATIDPSDCSRTFSIASAPYENHIEVVARIRDNEYKKALEELPIGSDFIIDGPYGVFKLHDDESIPVIFLTAGVGITPALSMLRQMIRDKSDYATSLFYINRNLERTAYYDTLKGYESALRNFQFIPTMTRADASKEKWQGETGYITIEMLEKYIPDFTKPIFYIVAATDVVWNLVDMISSRVKREQIRVEDFTGF